MKSLIELRKLRFDESGTSITEMVITLPIFLMIFSGMGMLYRLNQEALIVKAEAYSHLWADDADGTLLGMVPIAGALTSIDSIGDVFQNGLTAGGIYVDSGVKTKIPATIMPGSGLSPKYTIGGITGGTDDMVNNRLLNDFANPTFNGGGFSAIFSSILQTTGAGLAVGAGIRYGASEADVSRNYDAGVWGSGTFESGKLSIPARTAATHRLAPVLLTRFEISQSERFDQSIPVFEIDPNFSNETTSEGDSCQTQATAYQDCAAANPDDQDACDDSIPSDDCQGVGGSGAFGDINTSWTGGMGG